ASKNRLIRFAVRLGHLPRADIGRQWDSANALQNFDSWLCGCGPNRPNAVFQLGHHQQGKRLSRTAVEQCHCFAWLQPATRLAKQLPIPGGVSRKEQTRPPPSRPIAKAT